MGIIHRACELHSVKQLKLCQMIRQFNTFQHMNYTVTCTLLDQPDMPIGDECLILFLNSVLLRNRCQRILCLTLYGADCLSEL